jgi:outer membrane autotransporter protein
MATTLLGSPALAQCAASGTNQTCTNSVTLSGLGSGIEDNGTLLTVTNTKTGVLSGITDGIYANGSANVTNFGIITGIDFAGIFTRNTLNLTNSGTISGFAVGASSSGTVNLTNFGIISAGNSVDAPGISANTANVTNFGTISATGPGSAGINAFNANVTNFGTISGSDFGILSECLHCFVFSSSNIFNSGTISGGTAAIRFTTLSHNTLTLGPGSVINGLVLGAGADTFQLGGTGADTFDVSKIGTQYQGFATFNKIDVSTWTLTGTGLQTWNVLGGVLAGNATIGGLNVMSGGTVMPGNFGTLNVNGNVTFAAGSVFGVNANAAGQADRIAATGTATIAGGTVQVLAQFGNFAPLTTYTILTATGGVTGTFANAVDNFAFLTPSLTYTPTSVLLTLIHSSMFASEATTPNQNAVAAALDKGPLTNPLVLAVLVQTTPGAQQAFDALSGEIYGSVRTILLEDSFVLRQELLSRLRQAAYAGASGELDALAFGGPEVATDDGQAMAYAPTPAFPVKAAPATAAPGRDWTLWAKALGGWGRADGDGNAAGVSSNFAGFITGADARFGDMLRLGIAAGYTHSSIDVDARASSAGIDSAHVGAYAGANLGPLDLRGGAAYSFHTIDTTRTVMFPGFLDHTAGRFDGGTAQVFGEVGHGMTLARLAVEPFAGLAFVRVNTASFLESGGLAALSGAASADDVGYSSVGLRAATMIPLANGHWLVPRIAVAWQHAFSDVTPATALAFQSTGAAFSTTGVPIARDSALVEGGLDLRLSPRAKLSLNYAGELAASIQTHSVKGGFTWNF